MTSQFIHLASVGLKPGKKKPRWACIAGVCAEGARAPHASRHIPFPVEPRLIHGITPIEAGRIAEERARQARDAAGKKQRDDGTALLAGVVSFPIPRQSVDTDPLDQDIYALWVRKTLAWLLAQFGEHLRSVVEHTDERYYHLHFFVVPTLGPRNRLNVGQLHPGYYARLVALAEGADKKNGERSYRKAMRAWQDAYYHEVSKFFRHDRYGPRRARVGRREREMQQAMEAERARLLADIEHKRAVAEHDGRRRGWEMYAQKNEQLQQQNALLQAAQATLNTQLATLARRCRAAEATGAALRNRLVAREPTSPGFGA
jgi:hypothetical protein